MQTVRICGTKSRRQTRSLTMGCCFPQMSNLRRCSHPLSASSVGTLSSERQACNHWRAIGIESIRSSPPNWRSRSRIGEMPTPAASCRAPQLAAHRREDPGRCLPLRAASSQFQTPHWSWSCCRGTGRPLTCSALQASFCRLRIRRLRLPLFNLLLSDSVPQDNNRYWCSARVMLF